MVGPDEGQGLLDGGVAPGRGQRVLEAVPLRGVVVDVVGRGQRRSHVVGQPRQFPVARGVAFQEILLEFHVHPVPGRTTPGNPRAAGGLPPGVPPAAAWRGGPHVLR